MCNPLKALRITSGFLESHGDFGPPAQIPAVKSGDLMQVQPFGERYHASIHDLELQRRVGGEQFGHSPVVMRRDLDDTEFVVGDGGAEFGGQADAPTPLRRSLPDERFP
ncbi:MAG TPA: hypothetical protein VFQ68_35240 [Streptosporangiaceae bacterium]|nr:hypothetical protein [Streptosporangiaceae bacterium]